jgi:uncharacterized repeat protein (TIGR01451 family)
MLAIISTSKIIQITMPRISIIQKLLFILLVSIFPLQASAWYDTNVVGTAPDWHFRVPINIPATATQNSTIKLDVNFTTLLTSLGSAGTLDVLSPRVVRANDITLVNRQEFTDTLFANITDAANNNRGEIKFIYDDNGANTYYLYFDITANGVKLVNSQPPINGNFEHSAAGTTPSQWTIATAPAGVSNQNNEVHDTAPGATYSNNTINCSDGSIASIDDAPRTGRRWHLSGYRNLCETGNLREQIMLRKTLTVPASTPGNLTLYFQLQAFDDINYDYFRVKVNGTVINQTILRISNPSLTVTTTKIGRTAGYGGLIDAGWTLATLNLAGYAGTSITIELATVFAGDNVYRTWVKLDDVEWSIKSATLGAPQKYGPLLTLSKTSAVISDPFFSPNPKRIPGAVVEYTIKAVNSGTGIADNNTVIISDPIPANTHFVVNSIQFTAAAPVYSGLAAGSGNFTYSLDGTIYGPSQTTNITHFKVAPTGQFLAPTLGGAGNPAFTVKYRVTID